MLITRLTSPVLIIAYKEICDSSRNRWLAFMGSMFLVLSLSVSFAGSAVTGSLYLPEIDSLMSSLSTISVFIIPLAAILLCYDSFVGEDESGTLLLLLSYPLTRLQILLGKLLGHVIVMLVATGAAFGLTALLLLMLGEHYDKGELIAAFAQFLLSSNLLALTFILISYIVSLKSTEKAKAIGGLLLIWFLFVLIYDLILLTILVSDFSFADQYVINALIAMSPTDLYRAINLVAIDGNNASGSLAMLASSDWGLASLYGLLLLWISSLTLLSHRIFKYKPL
ncbi:MULTISPECIES: ABC transporter permease [Shewanella]|uniref:ABC transporter permease subunit n=1 Tax=Shewanella fidelis TaxID=173509 RepID=A0AAW8NQE1_9GAMM|nr:MULTISPECIES: ABC transporter permease subunit [Shewanella]MDR8525317.1 ABC transporter permease subunit [Shewanella fidelis]MDW4813646.1 ABC transporter permease subunit [Shewanella fidelis]MDW4817696.1 ABC transporter permease subunit [Shewanella fidelis]MDW4821763.1 ABC transporter permease subunit [Shewanella fidelis]MDW4825974.1 ABC transporter permease subunit [Shewanella fidelis]